MRPKQGNNRKIPLKRGSGALSKVKIGMVLRIYGSPFLFGISITIYASVSCVLFLATTVSLLFGQPLDQFQLANQFMILQGQNMLSLGIMVLAPLMEELGWRGYGVDSLRSRLNLFKTSLLFGLLWALWHVPLFFIQGYYQNTLWNTSLVYVANFFISIFLQLYSSTGSIISF